MGVYETLLLLGGSAIAIAIVIIVAYRGSPGRKTVSMSAFSPVSTATEAVGPVQTSAEQPVIAEHAVTTIETPYVEPATNEIVAVPPAMATLATPEEAPPPFPEESSSRASIPTDVTAVSNIASPTESATTSLVISTPKLKTARASRKRLPTSTTPGSTAPRRRRASTKAKTSAQVSIAPAAPDAAMQAEHQE
ncbi:MAG: hypothetical protein ACYC7D_10860 [Nitrososphaerales archaeon]